MTYKLSLLDKSPVASGGDGPAAIAATIALAQRADRLGYHRFWLAEHHGLEGLASAAPEVLAAHLLARTQNLRIGTAGILLQHYSPYKVAEVASVLAAIAPGRVDLGIGKAPGGLPRATQALQSDRAEFRPFEEKLTELDAYLRGEGAAVLQPRANPLPQLFLLGASPVSARLASGLGWGFVHGGHHDGDAAGINRTLAAHAAGPSRAPALLAVTAYAAPSRAEADEAVADVAVFRLELPNGQAVNLGSTEAAIAYAEELGVRDYTLHQRRPRIVAGTAEEVHEELRTLQGDHRVDEFVLDIPVADPALRLRSIDLLAHARRRAAA